MKFTATFTLMFYLLISVSLSACAGVKPHQYFYDVTQFDVAGVKLGMSLQEARDAVIEHLDVPESAIQWPPHIDAGNMAKTKAPLYFSVITDEAKLIVFFKPAVPADKTRPLRVHTVSYKLRRHSKEIATIKASVLKQYGYPSSGNWRRDKHSRLEWCWVPPEKRQQGCAAKEGAYLNFIPYKITMGEPR